MFETWHLLTHPAAPSQIHPEPLVFLGDLEGRAHCAPPPPHSSYIQKPHTIRVKLFAHFENVKQNKLPNFTYKSWGN